MDIMRDPSTASSRIYVGNLPDNSRKEVEEYFGKFGKVVGTVLNRGFGFVQFERPESATMAIKTENGNVFMNRKISVRNVNGEKQSGNNDNNKRNNWRNNPGGGQNKGGGNNPWRERSPFDDRDRSMSNNMDRPGIMVMDRGSMIGSGDRGGILGGDRGSIMGSEREGVMGADRGGLLDPDRHRLVNNDRGLLGRERPMMGGGLGQHGSMLQGDNSNSAFGGRDDWTKEKFNSNFGGSSSNFDPMNIRPGPNFVAQPDKNDCEIIVVSKTLTEYAEMIEAHLKRRGLTVDLLFPNDDVPIGKVLANISSRGTLYAILVTPQNEEHRSITVNILYGTPAEHRNMPVEDALNFIVLNYQQKLKCDKAGIPVPSAVPITPAIADAPPLSERHPDSIQILINLLANNRPLTVLQYDRVLKYLEGRRDLQKRVEIGDDDISPLPVKTGPDPEEELQRKIMSILNKPSMMTTPSETNFHPQLNLPVNNRQQSSSSTLLHDPKVQKALDDLLQGSLMSGYKG